MEVVHIESWLWDASQLFLQADRWEQVANFISYSTDLPLETI